MPNNSNKIKHDLEKHFFKKTFSDIKSALKKSTELDFSDQDIINNHEQIKNFLKQIKFCLQHGCEFNEIHYRFLINNELTNPEIYAEFFECPNPKNWSVYGYNFFLKHVINNIDGHDLILDKEYLFKCLESNICLDKLPFIQVTQHSDKSLTLILKNHDYSGFLSTQQMKDQLYCVLKEIINQSSNKTNAYILNLSNFSNKIINEESEHEFWKKIINTKFLIIDNFEWFYSQWPNILKDIFNIIYQRANDKKKHTYIIANIDAKELQEYFNKFINSKQLQIKDVVQKKLYAMMIYNICNFLNFDQTPNSSNPKQPKSLTKNTPNTNSHQSPKRPQLITNRKKTN